MSDLTDPTGWADLDADGSLGLAIAAEFLPGASVTVTARGPAHRRRDRGDGSLGSA